MQLYHHPYCLDSQKVRIALEERGVDYTSHRLNPITGKNLDSFYFSLNPTAKLPFFQNGAHTIFDTAEIIKYVDRIASVSSGGHSHTLASPEVTEWMAKIQEWDPKYFTLSRVPVKYRIFVSKFLRRVIIARMAESPDLASAYHRKLREAYETEEKLKDTQVLRRSEEHLVRLLDEVEAKLGESTYLVGDEFTLADVMLIPILTRLQLLRLEEAYIRGRPNIGEYWHMVKQRPSYKKVIGRYFDGWRQHNTVTRTWCYLHIRSMLRKYRLLHPFWVCVRSHQGDDFHTNISSCIPLLPKQCNA